MNPGYPKTLIHPDHSPAIIGVVGHDVWGGATGTQARPERFPSVVVHDENQEARERARGYLAPGEQRPKVDGYHEYPMMMEHPEFEPEIKPYQEGKMGDDGVLRTWMVKGSPGKFPPQIAKDGDEEKALREKGYVSGGLRDGRAYERAQAHISMDYNPAEWPKYIDGVLMSDPETPMNLDAYPKWVTSKSGEKVVVADWSEECEVTGRGSSRNEPTKRTEPENDPDYAEFLAWKAARLSGAVSETTAVEAALDERSQLVTDAEELGITVDKRWGTERLRREIEKALEKSAAE